MRSDISWSNTLAVYGGTFDPPHLGHTEAVRGLFRHPGVQRVWVMPSAQPPHKSDVTPAPHRLAMTQLAFEGLADVTVDEREIHRSLQSGLPSYTFDTLSELRQELGPQASLAFVIGVDQLESLPTWSRFPKLLSLCHWIVLERKPDGEDRARSTLRDWAASGLLRPVHDRFWSIRDSQMGLELVPTTAQALASHEIRRSLQKTGQPPTHSLSPAVFRYLKTHRLYGSSPD